MDVEEHDNIIRHLLLIAAQQNTLNETLHESMRHQRESTARQDNINERLTTAIERLDGAIERLDITQARIETLLARMLRYDDNGR